MIAPFEHEAWFQANLVQTLVSSGLMALVILSMGAIVVGICKQGGASATLCYQVWAATVACLIMLPMGAHLLPTWGSVRISSLAERTDWLVDVAARRRRIDDAPFVDAHLVASSDSIGESGDPAAREMRQSRGNELTRPFISAALLTIIWLVGFGVVVLRTLGGLYSLRSLRLESKAVTDPALLNELNGLKAQLGICWREVRLAVGDRRAIPMTWGFLQPTIYLPQAALTDWSEKTREVVLLHELTHVKRYDALMQLLARMACAFYWYNPLMWYAMRRLHIEQEAACDDAVLSGGLDGAEYAEHLTKVLVGARRLGWHVGVVSTIGQKGRLEQRIATIVNATVNRGAPTARQTICAAGVIIALTLAVASAGPLRFRDAGEPPLRHAGVESGSPVLIELRELPGVFPSPASDAAPLWARSVFQMEVLREGDEGPQAQYANGTVVSKDGLLVSVLDLPGSNEKKSGGIQSASVLMLDGAVAPAKLVAYQAEYGVAIFRANGLDARPFLLSRAPLAAKRRLNWHTVYTRGRKTFLYSRPLRVNRAHHQVGETSELCQVACPGTSALSPARTGSALVALDGTLLGVMGYQKHWSRGPASASPGAKTAWAVPASVIANLLEELASDESASVL